MSISYSYLVKYTRKCFIGLATGDDVIKLFSEEISISPELKNFKIGPNNALI